MRIFRFEQGQIGLRHCFKLNLSRFALQLAELLGDIKYDGILIRQSTYIISLEEV